jgi:hypothetical protein
MTEIERQQRWVDELNGQAQVQAQVPDDLSLPQLAEMVVRGKIKLGREQMRMLIELLPFHMNKMPAKDRHSEDTARMLDAKLERAKARSRKAQILKLEDLRGRRDPRE